MKILFNQGMKEIMKQTNSQEIDVDTKESLDIVINNVRILKNCLIYDTEGINETDIDLERLLKFTGDLSGYESGVNEIMLNKTSRSNYLTIAVYVLNELKKRFSDREIAVYVIIKDKYIEIKFHTYRIQDELLFNIEDVPNIEPTLCVYG